MSIDVEPTFTYRMIAPFDNQSNFTNLTNSYQMYN